MQSRQARVLRLTRAAAAAAARLPGPGGSCRCVLLSCTHGKVNLGASGWGHSPLLLLLLVMGVLLLPLLQQQQQLCLVRCCCSC